MHWRKMKCHECGTLLVYNDDTGKMIYVKNPDKEMCTDCAFMIKENEAMTEELDSENKKK